MIFNDEIKFNFNPEKILKVKIGLNKEEQLLRDNSRRSMFYDIYKLLNHKIINVNKEELDMILECEEFFKNNNTLCIQIDSNNSYWIKFKNKGENSEIN